MTTPEKLNLLREEYIYTQILFTQKKDEIFDKSVKRTNKEKKQLSKEGIAAWKEFDIARQNYTYYESLYNEEHKNEESNKCKRKLEFECVPIKRKYKELSNDIEV